MKLYTAWWGIELSAENEEDEQLLKQLVKRLPEKPTKCYDDGTVDVSNKPQNEWADHEGFTITFNR